MFNLDGKHWALIAGFLGATGGVVGALGGWSELTHPAVVGALFTQFSLLITAIYVQKPEPK